MTTFADWWAAVPYPMGVGSRDIARAAWDAATAAERERILELGKSFAYDCCEEFKDAIRDAPPPS
jgi:hypothetical protein